MAFVKAVWDSDESLYHVTWENVKTGKQATTKAEILVSALGILEIPRFPAIPGLSEFKGNIFHSARWVDKGLDGKQVAVIGNGASATQFLPIIAKRPGINITQFCRTPNWILPPVRMYYSDFHRFMCRYVPLYMRIIRFLYYSVSDIAYFLIFSNSTTRRRVENFLRSYIISSSPDEYHKHLIPKYDLGCRRAIFDTEYLSTLHRSNVRLHYDGITSIVEDGIITKEGKHLPFDTIILATGYRSDSYPLRIEGKEGQTIQEYYESKGGPTAYMGTTIPGFPNLYMIGGPNTATGHTSVIFTEEVQVNYSLDLIKPILRGKLSSVDVTHEATDRYNELLQDRLSRSVFVGCNSWYRVNGAGKVNSSSAHFWWWLRRPIWTDYEVKGHESGQTLTGSILWLGVAVAAAVGSWILRHVNIIGSNFGPLRVSAANHLRASTFFNANSDEHADKGGALEPELAESHAPTTIATLRPLYNRAARAFLLRDIQLTQSLIESAFSQIHPPDVSTDLLADERRKWDILRITLEFTVYSSSETPPESLKEIKLQSPQALLTTLHGRSLSLFTPKHSNANSMYLPTQVLITLIYSSLRLGAPDYGRIIIEDWLSRRDVSPSVQEKEASGGGYGKIIELYCLQILPKLEQWEYAQEFLEYEGELPVNTREVITIPPSGNNVVPPFQSPIIIISFPGRLVSEIQLARPFNIIVFLFAFHHLDTHGCSQYTGSPPTAIRINSLSIGQCFNNFFIFRLYRNRTPAVTASGSAVTKSRLHVEYCVVRTTLSNTIICSKTRESQHLCTHQSFVGALRLHIQSVDVFSALRRISSTLVCATRSASETTSVN
ncbi:hypothetical protein DXG01_008467 [Tephrocybe rancida]|nr:hypothetical protein DXG01_008467 [Tephrocybe rancida]